MVVDCLVEKRPELIKKLKTLVEDTTCGDPESPLLWTCKSTRQLSEAINNMGYKVGRQKISELLCELGYSLQGNKKTKAGSSHPDRNKQFRFLNRRVKIFQCNNQPVISYRLILKRKNLLEIFQIKVENGNQRENQ